MYAMEILELARLERIAFLDRFRTDEERHYVIEYIKKVERELEDISNAIKILKRGENISI